MSINSQTVEEKPELLPCPFCSTEQREVFATQSGHVGIIFHRIGCYFAPKEYDRRMVLGNSVGTPKGISAWNNRHPLPDPPTEQQ